jgi:NAD(P)H-dependent FMN reductase
MLKVKIIIASTRPGRKGPIVAKWIEELAAKKPELQIEALDLAAINLPMMDEPHHPMLQKYEHQHTKDWSAKINDADAYIIVMPEYNYSFTAPLKNAIDYLHKEWGYKPVGLVSYGGMAGGTRAVQMFKQVLTTLRMMPIPESVNIPFFTKYIGEDGRFTADEGLSKSAEALFSELIKWGDALKALREPFH